MPSFLDNSGVSMDEVPLGGHTIHTQQSLFQSIRLTRIPPYAPEQPETDANRGSWATNSLASDKFHNLEGQKETDTLAASGGLSDEMMKRKPGGSETPGANALKDAWDRFVSLSQLRV